MLKGESLVVISEDSSATKAIDLQNDSGNPTVNDIYFDELKNNPYKYNEEELINQVHVVRRGRNDLHLSCYSMKRSDLLKKYGWGLHVNLEHKIALVPVESKKYQKLLDDPAVKKIKAYRSSKK